jgi:hypothetical protein
LIAHTRTACDGRMPTVCEDKLCWGSLSQLRGPERMVKLDLVWASVAITVHLACDERAMRSVVVARLRHVPIKELSCVEIDNLMTVQVTTS